MPLVSVTVAERTNVFGLAPSDKWGAYNWGFFKWGEGTAPIPVMVGISIAETEAATGSIGMGLGLAIAETEAATGNAAVTPVVVVGEIQASTGALADFYRLDAAGYFYVFPDRATDETTATSPSWTARASSTASWTSSAATATSWS